MRHAANALRECEPNQSGATVAGLHIHKQAGRVNKRPGTSIPTCQQQKRFQRRKIEPGCDAQSRTQLRVPELGLMCFRIRIICITEQLVSMPVVLHSAKRFPTVSKPQTVGHGEAQTLQTYLHAHTENMRDQHMSLARKKHSLQPVQNPTMFAAVLISEDLKTINQHTCRPWAGGKIARKSGPGRQGGQTLKARTLASMQRKGAGSTQRVPRHAWSRIRAPNQIGCKHSMCMPGSDAPRRQRHSVPE